MPACYQLMCSPRLMFLMEEKEFPKEAPKAQAGGGPDGDKQEEPTPESKACSTIYCTVVYSIYTPM